MDVRYEMYLAPHINFTNEQEQPTKETMLYVKDLPEGWYSKIGGEALALLLVNWCSYPTTRLEDSHQFYIGQCSKTLDIVSKY